MNNLSPRLMSICKYIEDNEKVADIGCDHSLLGIYLTLTKNNVMVIASDVNKKALDNAKKNIQKYKVDIDIRLGSGLTTIKNNEVNTIIIAGMGTYSILGIINRDINRLSSVNKLIIQTNTKVELLRKQIIKYGFYIKNESLILDNKQYYTIIVFEKGKSKYNKRQLFLGPCLIKENSRLFQEKNKYEVKRLSEINKSIPFYRIVTKINIYFKIKLYKTKK